MSIHPEIKRLSSLRKQFDISIRKGDEHLCNRTYFPKVEFSIGEQSFEIYVDDEYDDLKINNSDLHLCLVLRSLENYLAADDFLAWCQELNLDPSNSQARQYHMELGGICTAIQLEIGTINSFVYDFDFEMNAGAAQELRRI